MSGLAWRAESVRRDVVLGLGLQHGLRPVSGSIEALRLTFDVSHRLARILLVVVLVAIATSVWIAIRYGYLTQVAGIATALIVLALSLRRPYLPLFAFALLIPVEEVVVLGDIGTLSRLAAVLFIVTYGLPRLGRIPIRVMPAAGWGFVAWAALSVAWALDPSVALSEIPILVFLFATGIFIAAAIVERPSVVRPLLWAYSLSAGATALLGIYDYFTGGLPGDPNSRAAALQDQNPAYFAAALLPALIFVIFELISGRYRLLSALIMAVSTVAIVVSGTRAAWLAAAVVVLVMVVPRLDVRGRVTAVFAAFVVAAVLLQLPGAADLVIQRTDIAISTGGAGRTDIWTVGLSIYRTRPITGVGLANFPNAYTPEIVRESDVGLNTANDPAYRAPHSLLISTLAELGPVGLALLAFFLLPLALQRGWGPDAAMIQAGIASLLVTALFLDVVNRKQVWLLIGIACGLAYLAREARKARGSTRAVIEPVVAT